MDILQSIFNNIDEKYLELCTLAGVEIWVDDVYENS